MATYSSLSDSEDGSDESSRESSDDEEDGAESVGLFQFVMVRNEGDSWKPGMVAETKTESTGLKAMLVSPTRAKRKWPTWDQFVIPATYDEVFRLLAEGKTWGSSVTLDDGTLLAHRPLTHMWGCALPHIGKCSSLGIVCNDGTEVEDLFAVIYRSSITKTSTPLLDMVEDCMAAGALGMILVNDTEPGLHIDESEVGTLRQKKIQFEAGARPQRGDPALVQLYNWPVVLVREEDGPMIANKAITVQGNSRDDMVLRNIVWFKLIMLRINSMIWRAGFCSMSGGVLALIFAYYHVEYAFYALLAAQVVIGQLWQRRLVFTLQGVVRDNVEKKWPECSHLEQAFNEDTQGSAWGTYVAMGCVPLPFIVSFYGVLLETIAEFFDPTMDGHQVGTALHTDNPAFRDSWKPVCKHMGPFQLICPTNMGLGGSMLFVFVLSILCPLLIATTCGSLGTQVAQTIFFKLADPQFYEDDDDVLYALCIARISRWSGAQVIADMLNLPLVAFVFRKLAEADHAKAIELQERGAEGDFKLPKPIKDVYLFLARVIFEAIWMLWLQISLVSFTMDAVPLHQNVIAFVSLFTSIKTVLSALIGASVEVANGAAPRWGTLMTQIYAGDRRVPTMDNFQREKEVKANGFTRMLEGCLVMLLFLTSIILAMCFVRICGLFFCDSRVFNISQLQCFDAAALLVTENSTTATPLATLTVGATTTGFATTTTSVATTTTGVATTTTR